MHSRTKLYEYPFWDKEKSDANRKAIPDILASEVFPLLLSNIIIDELIANGCPLTHPVDYTPLFVGTW